LTHISNEVPFVEDCPYPNPVQQEMRFCSRDRYLELLVDVGADVIELTGDHFSDWGHAAMLHTLDLYEDEGWLVYGGGEDLKAARQSITVEHNGNRLAFLGCNAKPLNYAHATESTPGAAPCDFEWMEAEIERLRNDDYLPIVTFQHIEYYTYAAQPDQRRDAQRMTQAGAVIVSGSQAHQPQALEFSDGGFVHHGLGNLFFDQYGVSESTRQGFIDRHVFYDGRHIGTELLTIMFIDYARPRPMTAEERVALLEAVFQASEW
jgi:poly-gamma-glutamate synthesis protein (capsule biosynthesis protein)